jgi:hypothetical protein
LRKANKRNILRKFNGDVAATGASLMFYNFSIAVKLLDKKFNYILERHPSWMKRTGKAKNI